MNDTGVGYIIAGAILILTLIIPTALWVLWSVTGFANSIGAPEFAWWQFVVGTWIAFIVKAFIFTGVTSNGN